MGAHNRPLPCHWFPISSHLVGRLSAHLQICQVTIYILELLALSLRFCPPPFLFFLVLFCFGCVVFLGLSKESSLFQLALFRLGEQGSALMPWRLLVFYRERAYVFFMMWYTAWERERWVRTYQRQAAFSAWCEDENDMRISEPPAQHLRLHLTETLTPLLPNFLLLY